MEVEKIKRRAIRIIAVSRFSFIDQGDWPDDYVTITNDSERKRGIFSTGRD